MTVNNFTLRNSNTLGNSTFLKLNDTLNMSNFTSIEWLSNIPYVIGVLVLFLAIPYLVKYYNKDESYKMWESVNTFVSGNIYSCLLFVGFLCMLVISIGTGVFNFSWTVEFFRELFYIKNFFAICITMFVFVFLFILIAFFFNAKAYYLIGCGLVSYLIIMAFIYSVILTIILLVACIVIGFIIYKLANYNLVRAFLEELYAVIYLIYDNAFYISSLLFSVIALFSFICRMAYSMFDSLKVSTIMRDSATFWFLNYELLLFALALFFIIGALFFIANMFKSYCCKIMYKDATNIDAHPLSLYNTLAGLSMATSLMLTPIIMNVLYLYFNDSGSITIKSIIHLLILLCTAILYFITIYNDVNLPYYFVGFLHKADKQFANIKEYLRVQNIYSIHLRFIVVKVILFVFTVFFGIGLRIVFYLLCLDRINGITEILYMCLFFAVLDAFVAAQTVLIYQKAEVFIKKGYPYDSTEVNFDNDNL